MGFPFFGGVDAPGFRAKKMSDPFRFERLPFMSSAEDHPNRSEASGQPFPLHREHS